MGDRKPKQARPWMILFSVMQKSLSFSDFQIFAINYPFVANAGNGNWITFHMLHAYATWSHHMFFKQSKYLQFCKAFKFFSGNRKAQQGYLIELKGKPANKKCYSFYLKKITAVLSTQKRQKPVTPSTPIESMKTSFIWSCNHERVAAKNYSTMHINKNKLTHRIETGVQETAASLHGWGI